LIRAAWLALALAVGQPAVAQTAFPMNPAAEKVLKEYGVMVMYAGACERHLNRDERAAMQTFVSGSRLALDPADEAYRPEIVQMFADLFAEGKRRPSLTKVTRAECVDVIGAKLVSLNARK
jgi:hypothetical protein